MDMSDTLRDFCESITSVSFDGSSTKDIERLIEPGLFDDFAVDCSRK
jgi:hypothetical protein